MTYTHQFCFIAERHLCSALPVFLVNRCCGGLLQLEKIQITADNEYETFENWSCMQILTDTDFIYHGISFNERLAIFRLFHDDDEFVAIVEPGSAGFVTEGFAQ
jgi:hypothetical protein